MGDVRKHHVKKHAKLELKIHNEMVPVNDARCPKRPHNINTDGRDKAEESRHKQPCLIPENPSLITTRDEGITFTKKDSEWNQTV